MFTAMSHFISRVGAKRPAVMSDLTAIGPPRAPVAPRIQDYYIRVSERAVPQIRQTAGITQFDLIEIIANGHYRSLRERAVGSAGAWSITADACAALADVARDLHLLVFDPEREAFVVAYAKADPQAERMTITRVVTAQHYQQSRWQLLSFDLCQDLCAQSISSPQHRARILAEALGDRHPDNLPIIFLLQNDKRAVWVEMIGRDGQQRRIGLLPFEFKKMAARILPTRDDFWSWVQSTRDDEDSPIVRSSVAGLRFVAYNDPYEQVVPVLA